VTSPPISIITIHEAKAKLSELIEKRSEERR